MNIKILFLLVVSLCTLTNIYADTEYKYELEIDYDFDEDEEIECKLDLGDSKKTKTFDDRDDRDDMSFDGRFDDSIEVDCDERVDIELRVLDLDDNEVEDISERNTKDFVYELELFEAVIDFEYKFPDSEEILNCELEIDERVVDYKYNKSEDGDKLREEIEYEFLKETKFSCSEKLDELELKIEDPRGFDIYELFLEEEDEVEFDEDTPRHVYDIAVFFTKNFNDDEVECDVEIDSNNDFTLEFDDSTSGKERTLEYVFGEVFEINCDDEFEEAIVDIVLLEDDDTKVFEAEYFDKRSIKISKDDIENWEEEKEIEKKEEESKSEEVEKKEEKVITPTVVNPQAKAEYEEKKAQEELREESTQTDSITSESQQEELELTSNSTKINQSNNDLEEQNNVDENKNNIVYTFIGIVASIILIAIIVLVIKL